MRGRWGRLFWAWVLFSAWWRALVGGVLCVVCGLVARVGWCVSSPFFGVWLFGGLMVSVVARESESRVEYSGFFVRSDARVMDESCVRALYPDVVMGIPFLRACS